MCFVLCSFVVVFTSRPTLLSEPAVVVAQAAAGGAAVWSPRADLVVLHEPPAADASVLQGQRNCTPEIDTSEIIKDFEWHFPVDFQWHVPMELHLSVVFSEGLSLVQWIVTGIVPWNFSGVFQWNFTFVISGVYYLFVSRTTLFDRMHESDNAGT